MFVFCFATVVQRIAGLDAKGMHAYQQAFRHRAQYFQCLAEPDVVIPIEQFNDDFCDCLADGSDEPSTTACAGLHTERR